jgi:hypothetical protein
MPNTGNHHCEGWVTMSNPEFTPRVQTMYRYIHCKLSPGALPFLGLGGPFTFSTLVSHVFSRFSTPSLLKY